MGLYRGSLQEIAFPESNTAITTLETNYGSVELYTDKALIEEFSVVCSKLPNIKPYNKKILTLIEKDIIRPARYNRSYLNFLMKKAKVFFLNNLLGFMDKTSYVSMIGGFYTPKENKVYVLIDNQVDIFNTLNKENIGTLLIHELSHYCATNHPTAYSNLAEKYMTYFYYNVLGGLGLVNYDRQSPNINAIKIINKYVKDLFFNGEIKGKYTTPLKIFVLLDKLKDNLKPYCNHDADYIETKFQILLEYIASSLTGNIYPTTEWLEVYRTIYIAYVKLGANKSIISNTLFYQEFIYPSEIMAILSSNPKLAMYMKLI